MTRKSPKMPTTRRMITDVGNFTNELQEYISFIEQLDLQLQRGELAFEQINTQLQAVVMIPGSGDFVYDTIPNFKATYVTEQKPTEFFGLVFQDTKYLHWQNTIHQLLLDARADRQTEEPTGDTDFVKSVQQLREDYPTVKNVSLVASWFGSDLRAGNCVLSPSSTQYFRLSGGQITQQGSNVPWFVNGVAPDECAIILQVNPVTNQLNYGGTPADSSLIRAIQHLKSQDYHVTFYPFILMNVEPGNSLPNPYGGNSQPVFPWRGRITCFPAPGQPGTVDGTAAARQQIESFVGNAEPSDFSLDWLRLTVNFSGSENSFSRMVYHYAHLCEMAGGVDAFIIGSEMRGVSWVRDENGDHPFVDALIEIAENCRVILGLDTKITYAADWSEFTPYQVPGGGLSFHLDKLWANPEIDAIGIDNYWPLSDWRGGLGADAEEFSNIYDPVYLLGNVRGGEGFDFFYANEADRSNQNRTPITDGLGKPWVYRYKDIKSWWLNEHYDRDASGNEASSATPWVPRSKPFWFTEIGCPAVDKGSNQPNVFIDPKSSESFFPYFSVGNQDDLIQNRLILAMMGFWDNDESNPISPVYGARMVDTSRIYAYCWDARPFPWFPLRADIWGDAPNYYRGHWLNGRPIEFPPPEESAVEGEEIELLPVIPMPKGDRAVNPESGELEPAMQHYLSQIETIAGRLSNLSIIAVREKARE
ncbi:MAG: glycoside hydrolase TIM-barrel-like domain-containing protein [Pseudomonadota bacterium]